MTRRKDLTSEERQVVALFLLRNSADGKLNYDTQKAAMTKWGCCRSSIARLCLELHKRGTIRRLATGINCSKSTVGRCISRGLIRAHSSAIQPDLTAPSKLLRLKFSLEQIEYDRICMALKFKPMHNVVHIDEKWFYITKTNHRFYLTPQETEPHRTCKSKKFITKVMFMCAMCRPIFDTDGSVLFDGKIGIFPFTEMVPAKRSSKNRQAGTLEEKTIQSITKEVIKDCIINKIIPAIKAKWPANASKIIFIQQDNAKPHIKDSDPDFRAAATADGFDIRIVHQPPNSPDTNINDLGWFRAIQSLQVQSGCLTEIMKVRGQNSYKLPHMKKGVLARQDALPLTLEVPKQLVEECIQYLLDKGVLEGIPQLKEALGIDTCSIRSMEVAFNQLMLIETACIG
ncbi:uncharacterized protein LOC130998136 [Salvia miltiorrhiza]|uniref:uncharacterized protein LOC130998136 n=1 Tax=Salvia miltiorrhiza TaxID=226208 RepID=UPI0025ABC580|nr:uncharacterized protein LOC130998136 [Salvia miltiorrhiza]